MLQRRTLLLSAGALPALMLAACQPEKPLLLGFIGGLTDRNADNGQSGLNAVTLAVEQFNRRGGVHGRLVELLVRDDAQSAETAARSAQELVDARVEALIGPFTSAMAKAVQPVTARADLFQISPTITSMDFYGKDDNLFRINRTTRDNARDYARVLRGMGRRRAAVAYDTRNRNFSESWLAEFRAALSETGDRVANEVPYESHAETDFAAVVRRMREGDPDSLLFIAGGLDVARLAQQARRQAPQLPLAASEWAATEQLLELGGEVVQGMLVVQNFDRDDTTPRYREFADAYFKRFQRHPGYSSVCAYDAATVLLSVLVRRRPDESLKAATLRCGPYQGLQQTIAFDANGDTQRQVFFTEIRDGRYLRLP